MITTAAIDPETERVLVAEAIAGRQGFERLYNSYFPRLYAYVCYRVGSVQDSEDIVSEVFLKVVEGLRQGKFEWRHEKSFAAWLFRIARNAVADYGRRGVHAGEDESIDTILTTLPFGGPSPEEEFEQKEQAAGLLALLRELPARRQEVITLKFFGGLRNSEIGTLLGLDERTVASHLCRGLEDLHARYLQQQAVEREMDSTSASGETR